MLKFSPADIIERIYLQLPTKFNKDMNFEDPTNLYMFFYGIANALQINTNLIDEIDKQTNLLDVDSASSGYLDSYINGLAGIGRESNEIDSSYRERYFNLIFNYNCTRDGIEKIIIDVTGENPATISTMRKYGAFANARDKDNKPIYFYNDPSLLSTYAAEGPTSHVGYIQLKHEPDISTLNKLCILINSVKASGVRIKLYWNGLLEG